MDQTTQNRLHRFFRRVVRLRRLIIGTVITLAVGLFGFVSLIPRLYPFKGDGVLRDGGFFSYPRYRVDFPPVDLSQSNLLIWSFCGIPPVSMVLSFDYIPTATNKMAYQALKDSNVELRVRIETARGDQVAEGKGTLSDWVLMESNHRCSIWHTNLSDLQFERSQTYHIRLELRTPSPQSSTLTVRPNLSGGGSEF